MAWAALWAPATEAQPAGSADAVPVVTSVAPERVALTLYRAPGRSARQAMNLHYLGGFALVTETRTIRLPPGKAVLRFEGVIGGIVPASAIVTGLPGGTIEKNRDARLLSAAALVDGTLGRQVILRRTDRASGRVWEQPATIVAGPGERGNQGVVLKTPNGIEALGCSGLGEGPRYDGVPAGLSAKPVLSVTTTSPREIMATVTLSYLADGFDWSASYVANVAGDGRSLELSAWLTVANANAETLPDAEVQAVAGKLQRQRLREIEAAAAKLELRCYPLGTTTSDLSAPSPQLAEMSDVVVTAQRRMDGVPLAMAAAPPPAPPPPPPPEDLGDLKLYRVPERVTVAANGQKQVALLAQPHVLFDRVHRIALPTWGGGGIVPATITLRLLNTEKRGLGIPLPAGTTTLYRDDGGRRFLFGQGTIGDVAKNGRARLTAGVSHQVTAQQTAEGGKRRIVASNANPFPVTVEVAIGTGFDRPFSGASDRLERIDGIQTWRPTIAPNSTREISYAIAEDR